MSETIVFPQLSSLNWPSYILEAWRALYALGVPEENIRFVPEVGHFAVPEISGQHPPGPDFDPLGDRLIVHRVRPSEVRPRLTVSVRADELDYFLVDPLTRLEVRRTRTVGRLAHFLPPLLAGLPGGAATPPEMPPLDALAQQVDAAYPEICAVLPEDIRLDLEIGVGAALMTLATVGVKEQVSVIREATAQITDPPARSERYAAWLRLCDKLPARDIDGIENAALPSSAAAFRHWAEALYGPNPEAAPPVPFWADLSGEESLRQRVLFREMEIVLSYETPWGRAKITRDLLEILTTEAFTATAVLDSLHGIGWAHGRIADMAAGETGLEGWFLSISGGRNSRSLLQTKLAEWAAEGGVLGIDPLDLAALSDTEQEQLWALAAWRRDTSDPVVLLETALQQLIHPEAAVVWTRFAPAPSRPGTLLAQPGSTAMLGGAAALLYPGVRLQLPVENSGGEGKRARAVLKLCLRLFLPVSCRVEVLWRESAARLDQPTYLRHEFQAGAVLSGFGVMEEEEASLSDPLML